MRPVRQTPARSGLPGSPGWPADRQPRGRREGRSPCACRRRAVHRRAPTRTGPSSSRLRRAAMTIRYSRAYRIVTIGHRARFVTNSGTTGVYNRPWHCFKSLRRPFRRNGAESGVAVTADATRAPGQQPGVGAHSRDRPGRPAPGLPSIGPRTGRAGQPRARFAGCSRSSRSRRRDGRAPDQPGRADRDAQPGAAALGAGVLNRRPPPACQPRDPGGAGGPGRRTRRRTRRRDPGRGSAWSRRCASQP